MCRCMTECEKYLIKWNECLDRIACLQCKVAYSDSDKERACLKAQLSKWETKKAKYEIIMKELKCAGFTVIVPEVPKVDEVVKNK